MTEDRVVGGHDRLASALSPISDAALRRGVVELFESARAKAIAGEADLIVLAARRLACVYQLLIANGMKPLPNTCTVVSDRFLDLDLGRGRTRWNSALILDDSVILGTTLRRIHTDVVAKLGAADRVSSWAVCVDVEQSADYMLDAVAFSALHNRDSNQVQRFSEEIVQALFNGGIPFFSDFPTTGALTYSAAEWEQHLARDDWYVADVTAPLFDGSRREALAQIPNDAVVDEFLGRVPRVVAALVDDFKVRSYATIGEAEVEVRFVPIALLIPCSPRELDAALDAVVGSSGPWRTWPPVAKHRLVQMYASSCALEMMLATSNGPYPAFDAGMLDGLQVELYFGTISGRVMDAFDSAVKGFRDTPPSGEKRPPRDLLRRPTSSWVLDDESVRAVLSANAEMIAHTGLPARPSPGAAAKIGLVFAHAISSVFGFVTAELEIPQRQQIKALGNVDAYESTFEAVPDRRVLAQGFTKRDLVEALAPDLVSGSSWSRALLSLGIDIGNDLGIVVPVTRHDELEDLVYRSYRLGETAPLAGKPLPRAAADADWDDLARTAGSGAPIDNVTTALADRHGPTTPDPTALERLRQVVARAVPGEIVLRMEGVVLEVTDTEFKAEFRDDVLEPPVRYTTFPRRQLGGNRDAVKRGSLVVWTVLDSQDDIAQRTSRVQIRREPALDTAQMTHDASALADLLCVDDAAVGS